jgi:hypothetical protein
MVKVGVESVTELTRGIRGIRGTRGKELILAPLPLLFTPSLPAILGGGGLVFTFVCLVNIRYSSMVYKCIETCRKIKYSFFKCTL